MKKRQDNKADQSSPSNAFQLIFAGILIAANLFLFRSVQGKKQVVEALDKQKKSAQIALANGKKDQRTGMLSASILNEQAGWQNATPVATLLLDYLTHIPKEIRVSSVFLDRPLLLRSLSEAQKNEYFHYTLALAGTASIELEETETGQAKYVIPNFLEETSSNFDSDFTLNRAETETGASVDRWHFFPTGETP